MATTPTESAAPSRGIARLIPATIVAVTVAIVFAQWIPKHFRSFQAFDSGIFLYAGEQLRQGHHLYRDVWDHKPPLIFIFNALGLTIGGGSPAGVLVLDYLCCAVFFFVAYRELRTWFGESIALLATAFGILFFRDITPQPNLGEVLSLPFQVAAYLLFAHDFNRGISLVRAASQGVLLALLFWTRPNGIAISIVYCSATFIGLLRDRRLAFLPKWAAAFTASTVIASLLIAVPFAIASSWHEVWFATFTFNQLYAGLASTVDRFRALWWMIQLCCTHGVGLLASAGAIALLFLRHQLSRQYFRLAAWIVVWLILEFSFAAYTGKLYGKNLIAANLPEMLTIALFFSFLTHQTSAAAARVSVPFKAAKVVVIALTIALSLGQFRQNAKALPSADAPIIREVQQRTSPAELVNFWGIFSPDTIFSTRRHCGTRYFSSIPLSHGELAYRELAPQALDDLIRSRPALIIQRDDPQFPSLTVSSRSPAWDTAATLQQKAQLMAGYTSVLSDPSTRTTIYRRR